MTEQVVFTGIETTAEFFVDEINYFYTTDMETYLISYEFIEHGQ